MDKLKLFEITFKKLSGDKTFMAYYLQQAMARENLTLPHLAQRLCCPVEDFYKLALCKAPEAGSADFHTRLEKIAAYANTEAALLQNLVLGFAANQAAKPKSRLAEAWAHFSEKIALPGWLTAAPQTIVYQAAILLCIVLFSAHSPKTPGLSLYMNHYTFYTDSIKHIQLSDNTSVYKNNL